MTSTAQKTMKLIASRRSPLAFADRPVEPADLRTLFEAARLAPSAFNEQPWRYLVAARDTDPAGFERLLSLMVPANAVWAAHAPVLVLTTAHQRLALDGRLNSHAAHDLGLSTGALIVQASALGLGVHAIGGFDREAARRALNLPDGVEPVAMLAVGYPGDPDTLAEPLRRRALAPSTRRPLDSVVFGADWGRPASLAVMDEAA